MIILVVILYAFFAFTFSLGKIMVNFAEPLFAVGVRMIVGGAVLLGYIIIKHRKSCYPKAQHWFTYIQLIIFSIFLPYTIRLWVLQYIPTNKASLLLSTAPFFTAILSYFIHKERFTWLQIIGLFIGFFGMIPILMSNTPLEQASYSIGFLSIEELIMFIGVASMSYGLIIMQKLVKTHACPPYLANSISMLCGGMLALGLSGIFEKEYIKGDIYSFIGILILQVAISNIICANLQASLLKKYSTTFMAFASFLSPLFTSLYGFLLFGETVTWHFFASFTIVLCGLVLYQYNDNKNYTDLKN